MRIPLAEVKKWKKVFQRGTVKIRTGINSLAPRPYLHSLSIYAKKQESYNRAQNPAFLRGFSCLRQTDGKNNFKKYR